MTQLCEGSTIESDALEIVSAEGAYLYSKTGKKYLDFFSQTWSLPLGHSNKAVLEAVRKQLLEITHLRTAYATAEKSELSRMILEYAPGNFSKVNFVLHGSLAVEGALKLAINYHHDRYKILYLENGFHGRTLATMGISWKIPQNSFTPYFGHGVEVKKDLDDIDRKMIEENPAALILELVQSNAGCYVLDKDLVSGIDRLCRKHDVTLIIDEVQTAFGCMGVNFFSSEFDMSPDIICFGKSIGGGFPLAGTIYKSDYHLHPGDHSFTFAHNPVCLTAGLAYLKEVQPYLANAARISRSLTARLEELSVKYPVVINPRCYGTKCAFDVVNVWGKPDIDLTSYIAAEALNCGLIIATSRYRQMGNSIMMQPPLIISDEEIDEAFYILETTIHTMIKKKDSA
ncbi:MAG: aspartate aminotransferase family protein [Spirochaetales bacterium]|nr:aspartate aminotransferase family protein [Spirochaetales bacterium]